MVRFNLLHCDVQPPFSDKNESAERSPRFPYESLSIAVAPWRLFGRFDDFDVLGLHNEIKRQEARMPVMDEVSAWLGDVFKNHEEIPGLLLHPDGIGSGSDACDMHAPGLEVDEEQNIERDETPESPYFLGEKVRSPHDFHMGLNELLP